MSSSYSSGESTRRDLSRNIRGVPRDDPQRPHLITSSGSKLDPTGRAIIKLPQLSYANSNSARLAAKLMGISQGSTKDKMHTEIGTYPWSSKKRAKAKSKMIVYGGEDALF
jgi:hypothetical protein